MGLFKRKEKKMPAQEFPFILTSSFRGYKKFPIVVHGDEEAEKNNAELGGHALKGKLLLFKSAKVDGNRTFLQVFIDDKKVGDVFDNTKVAEVLSGQIEAVYAMMEDETVVGNGSFEIRPRVRIFVKYVEI